MQKSSSEGSEMTSVIPKLLDISKLLDSRKFFPCLDWCFVL